MICDATRKMTTNCHSVRIQPASNSPPTNMIWIGRLTANKAAPIVLGVASLSVCSCGTASEPAGG